MNVMGLDVVCDGRLAFINSTQTMLLNEFFLLLPADKIVVEIQESVRPDENMIAACDRLKLEGYRLALDNLHQAILGSHFFPMSSISRLIFAE